LAIDLTCSASKTAVLDVSTEPATYRIEHEAIDGAPDVTIFEDLGNGQTKLTFIGNEPMEGAKK
jgi:hypothetical protein